MIFLNINDPVKNRSSSSDREKEAKEKVVAPIFGEITLTKEYVNTKKVNNRQKLITQSESP